MRYGGAAAKSEDGTLASILGTIVSLWGWCTLRCRERLSRQRAHLWGDRSFRAYLFVFSRSFFPNVLHGGRTMAQHSASRFVVFSDTTILAAQSKNITGGETPGLCQRAH